MHINICHMLLQRHLLSQLFACVVVPMQNQDNIGLLVTLIEALSGDYIVCVYILFTAAIEPPCMHAFLGVINITNILLQCSDVTHVWFKSPMQHFLQCACMHDDMVVK